MTSRERVEGIESWKAEFYPIKAKDCKEGKEVAHSLRKWRGLRKEALEKHQIVYIGGGYIKDTLGELFSIDAESCSLCCRFSCSQCPVATETDNACREDSEYMNWVDTGDPEPMITLLERLHRMEV